MEVREKTCEEASLDLTYQDLCRRLATIDDLARISCEEDDEAVSDRLYDLMWELIDGLTTDIVGCLDGKIDRRIVRKMVALRPKELKRIWKKYA